MSDILPDAYFEEFLALAVGQPGPQAAREATRRPWICRGVGNAVKRLALTTADHAGLVGIWSFAFEAGAKDCARLAAIIVSDPAVKGREIEALKLVGQGLGHAEILASLRASKVKRSVGKVVTFPSKATPDE